MAAGQEESAKSSVPIIGGVLDLRSWDGVEVFSLAGEWAYWNDLGFAGEEEIRWNNAEVRTVPHVWPSAASEKGYGSATYRLTVLLPQVAPPIDLHFSRILSSYRVLINGRTVVESGLPGETRNQSVPSRRSETVRVTPHGDSLELTVQISNFHYYRGGFTQAPTLGPLGHADSAERRRTLLEFFVLGGLITVGLYHFGLATQRPQERTYLLFGTIAVLLSLRTFMAGNLQADALLGLLGWEAFTTILYLALFLGVSVFAAYCDAVFPAEYHRSVLFGTLGVTALLAVVTAILPSWVYTATLRPFLLFAAALVIYTVTVAFRAALHHRDGAVVFLAGTLLLAVALVRDAATGSVPVQSTPILPLGALVFTFFQAVILSNRVSQSVSEVEELLRIQQRLIGENESLKDLTYIDALTDIANRRRFNETVEVEWARGIRHGRPLSLLMIDIDHFKSYNDSYGHGQGDICLQQVAAVLSSGLRRSVDFVARYGGEEFAVVLPDTDIENAVSSGEHLRQQVELCKIFHNQSPVAPFVTISVGAATTVPSTKESPYSLVEQADRALYTAKQHGRNRVERFNP